MRASEFINEQVGTALSGLAMGAGTVLRKVAGRLGTGAANVGQRLGGLETAGEKAAKKLAANVGLGKTGQTMAGIIGKGAGSYVKSKVSEPPKPGTVGTNQPVVKKGDKVGDLEVANVSGTDVELKAPKELGLGDKATIKVPKKDMGVR